MSQIYKGGVSSTPAVPTSFNTDLQDTVTSALTASTGVVVPQTNMLRLGGDNGIKTYELTLSPGELSIGFIRGSEQTTDAVTVTPVITQATNTDSTMTVQIIAAGFCTTNKDSVGIYGTAVINNTAGTAFLVNTVDLIKNSEASLATCNLTITTSGADFIVNVTGVAGLTINWDICLPGIIST